MNISPEGQRRSVDQNTLKRSDLDDFVSCYNPKNRHYRKESERFKSYTYEELTKRDKSSIPLNVPDFPRHTRSLGASRRKAGLPASANLDIFWLKDEALEESANLSGCESRLPGFSRHTQSLDASRRKAGSRYSRAASARSRSSRSRDHRRPRSRGR